MNDVSNQSVLPAVFLFLVAECVFLADRSRNRKAEQAKDGRDGGVHESFQESGR